MVRDRCSWEKVKTEIAKCEIRCANCHAVKTAKQFGWYNFGPEDEVVESLVFHTSQ